MAESEQRKKYREELFKLMQENPELPVVPMVDGEIPGDDSGYWLGAWGSARVDEYLFTHNHEWMVFKSDDDVFDVLERHLSDEEFEKLPETEEECRGLFNTQPGRRRRKHRRRPLSCRRNLSNRRRLYRLPPNPKAALSVCSGISEGRCRKEENQRYIGDSLS